MSIIISIILLQPQMVSLIILLSLSYAIRLIHTSNSHNKKKCVKIRHNVVSYLNTNYISKSHSEALLYTLNIEVRENNKKSTTLLSGIYFARRRT